MHRAAPVLVVLLLLLPAGIATAKETAAPPAWRLHPSEVIHYERRVVTTKDGKEALSGPHRLTLYGHDLRAEGQYRPVTLERADLPMILAMWLPGAAKAETKHKVDLVFPKVIPLRLKGKTRVVSSTAEAHELAGEWTFQSRGSGERTDTHEIKKGRAAVTATFDRTQGHVVHARVDLAYRYVKLKASSAEKPTRVKTLFDIRVKRRYPFRYEGFQADVDKAIDKGVAYLKTLQIKDGEEHAPSYVPHGKHRIGSTALAVLTLAACDVPRDDPTIRKALDWLLTQEPKRTYDRAICLMAFDKAYTPKGEHAALARGKQKRPRRDLTQAERRWCRTVADDLLSSGSSPGFWGYPSNSRRSLLKFDTSNSQYAVLGMRAAANLGFPIDESQWLGVVRYFKQLRERGPVPGAVRLVRKGEAVHDDGRYADTVKPKPVKAAGGFRYSTLEGSKRPWASMTCAGIACLAIARNALARMGSPKLNAALDKEIRQLMDGGWAWMEAHWGVDRHPEKPRNNWFFYYLYSLERAAVLDGVRRVGLKDWYFEGAVQLILRQGGKGNWDYGGGSDIAETCFALLFLKRATSPLVTTGD
ncbi:MAG: hypothetical protein QNJ98_17800 [Planctomycetota bacterium]|nr:hypothetical protein [Planctomycetota bacterium]